MRAVIFDLDGTLLDTIEDIAAAMNKVLAGRGYPSHPVETYKTLVGDGIEEMIRRALSPILAAAPAPEDISAIVRDYRREYDLCWRNHSRPYPGVAGLLAELVRRRVKLAVLSNKSHAFTTVMTAELLAGCPFDSVRGALPGVPLKPDPAPALSQAAEMGVAPGECLFVGDTKVDMNTARSAGMFPVGALWGFRTADELLASGAAALITSPAEMLELL